MQIGVSLALGAVRLDIADKADFLRLFFSGAFAHAGQNSQCGFGIVAHAGEKFDAFGLAAQKKQRQQQNGQRFQFSHNLKVS